MAPTRQTKIAYNKEKNENRLKKYSSTSVIWMSATQISTT
jgi:hypothetical protein